MAQPKYQSVGICLDLLVFFCQSILKRPDRDRVWDANGKRILMGMRFLFGVIASSGS
jgi:hypothetical protein